MITLTEFLAARLDDESALASIISSGGYDPQTWHANDDAAATSWIAIHAIERVTGSDYSEEDPTPVALVRNQRAEWAHMAYWDPARVLADVEAKRSIIAEHPWRREPDWPSGRQCRQCGTEYPCTTVRLLALPYRDHPDYQQEWTL